MFRRRILVSSRDDVIGQIVRAALEDDFHHFCTEVRAIDGRIQAINGRAPRQPYTLCAQAIPQLNALLGAELSPVAHEVTRLTDAKQQCTHLLELTGLAMAAAARHIVWRQYDIEVPLRTRGVTHPRLWRDGVLVLAWRVNGMVIESPTIYAGMELNQGLARWALSTLPQEEAEAALLLRRATVISLGREKNLDAQLHALPDGHCFSQQPQRAPLALRVVGSTWDFAARPKALCADDLSWLAFGDPDPIIGATASPIP